MNHTLETEWEPDDHLAVGISLVTLVGFLLVVAVGAGTGRTTLVAVVVFAFCAMLAGTALAVLGEFDTPGRRVWVQGLASGAMLASAMTLLAPKAITRHPEYGGFAIAAGYLLGYAGHELGHLLTHYDLPLNAPVAELTLHALTAGAIMGVAYGSLPGLTPVFGFGVLAHKLPAGVAGSEALDRSGLRRVVMVVPAAAVALAAIPLSLFTPSLSRIVEAIFFGVSTGVFAHVAIEVLPGCARCGSRSGPGTVRCSRYTDRLRRYAVVSTLTGSGLIVLLWQLLVM